MLNIKQTIIFAAVLIMIGTAILSACSENPFDSSVPNKNESEKSEKVVITFDYEKQSGHASNQFAVWIEDMNGQLIKTLCATKFTVNGGYKSRPDSIAVWVEKSGLASMTKSEADAIAEATPKSGSLSYTWDLTGVNGDHVPNGEYKFYVEGTMRWKNSVLFSGVITIGGGSFAVTAEAEYTYAASDNQAALTAESSENNMISAVTANYTIKED